MHSTIASRLVKLVCPVALAALMLATGAPAAHAQPGDPATAVREVGQPDFAGLVPNRLDARGIDNPSGVAIDRSRMSNGIWVVDARNNRVLGWRDLEAARGGVPADVILGQPAATTNGCNQGGLSALSLCFVETFRHFNEHPGVAVDAEGNVWVSDQRNYRVLGYRRPFVEDARADVVVGQESFDAVVKPWTDTSAARRVFGPSALATDADGNLYIADNPRVLEVDRPFAGDAFPDRVFGQSGLDAFDSYDEVEATQPHRLPRPLGLGVDGQGRLYVAEAGFDRVLIWSSPLTRQGAADLIVAQRGSGCTQTYCRHHKALAVSPAGDLWVTGLGDDAILGYRAPVMANDTPERVLPLLPPTSGESVVDARPTWMDGGMAVDGNGGLWLTDWNRVLGYTQPWDGGVVADRLLGQVRADQITADLVDVDGLSQPQAVALDESASPPHLYVVDAVNNRVLGWKDAESFHNGQPADLVLGQPDRWSSRCNNGGRSLRSLCLGFYEPGIAVDHRGTVWIADGGNARVLGYRRPFDEDAAADFLLGQPDPGSGQPNPFGTCAAGKDRLCQPGGVAVDGKGNVFVADLLKNRIFEYDDPLRRGTGVDRVIDDARAPHFLCTESATCFSAPYNTHPGYYVYGGALATDARGSLLIGNKAKVWVIQQPLGRRPRARQLIDLEADLGQQLSLDAPRGLAVDDAGRIYLSALRVYVFSRGGDGPLRTVGEPCRIGESTGLPEALGPQSLCAPAGLAISRRGELFVTDAAVSRVVAFASP